MNTEQKDQSEKSNLWEKYSKPFGSIGTFLSLAVIIYGLVSALFLWDSLDDVYPFIVTASILAFIAWLGILVPLSPGHKFWEILIRSIILLLIFVIVAGSGYWLWIGFQIRLEVIALVFIWLVILALIGLACWRYLLPALLGRKMVSIILKWIMVPVIVFVAFYSGLLGRRASQEALQEALQPHFEITALNTLVGDRNAYEVTDSLIGNQNNLSQYGVSITFTLEVRPNYKGQQSLAKVVALISGDGKKTLEKLLWDDFTNEASTKEIHLTLAELLEVSGLQANSDLSDNLFQSEDISFQQAKLVVKVVRAADKDHPWASREITIRNAPWDVRASLAYRHNKREADVYVKNLGGIGEFTIRYRLVRLTEIMDTNTKMDNNGVTYVKSWNQPNDELVRLGTGAIFTDTVTLPEQLDVGRYVFEVYAVKKQNYVEFDNPNTTWEDLNSMEIPWWFGEYPSTLLVFVMPLPVYDVNPLIQAEIERLKNDQGIDLGVATGIAEEMTSGSGSKGWRQIFQEGEVYLYNDQAYALYGSILEHYKKLGGVQYEMGFPTSPIETITSSSGITGTMMTFQGKSSSSAAIYHSKKGGAGIWGMIGQFYLQNAGSANWLGFPLVDEQYFLNSTSHQMFENGYIVYHYPEVEGKRDWSRQPVAYPYLASRGTLFDVQAQSWQDTGLQMKTGDWITIIQVGGAWTYREGEPPFDANGTSALGLQADTIIPTELVGTVVGRIGEGSDHIFSVGRWKEFPAPAEGNLYLAMNDNGYGDNAGFITVQIMVEPSKQE